MGRPTRIRLTSGQAPAETANHHSIADGWVADYVGDLLEETRSHADVAETRVLHLEKAIRESRQLTKQYAALVGDFREKIDQIETERDAETRRADAAETRLAAVEEELRKARRPLLERMIHGLRRRD